MISLVHQWNATNHKIMISVEFESPIKENLVLAENADVIFVGKEFANYFGYTKESVLYAIQKYSHKT